MAMHETNKDSEISHGEEQAFRSISQKFIENFK